MMEIFKTKFSLETNVKPYKKDVCFHLECKLKLFEQVDEEELGEAKEEQEATSQEGKDGEPRDQNRGQQDPQTEGEAQMVTEGEAVMENIIQRPPETYFHTLMPDQGDSFLYYLIYTV